MRKATLPALAADSVPVSIKAVRVRLEHLEAAIGNLPAVQVGRRRRDADRRGRTGRSCLAEPAVAPAPVPRDIPILTSPDAVTSHRRIGP
jgi:hypothetical protein